MMTLLNIICITCHTNTLHEINMTMPYIWSTTGPFCYSGDSCTMYTSICANIYPLQEVDIGVMQEYYGRNEAYVPERNLCTIYYWYITIA